MMKAIVAINRAGYIGKGGDLMYSISGDMKYFASTTKGKAVVMGRKTLLSLPQGKGLKGRTNILLSRTISDEEAKERNVVVVRDVKGLPSTLKKLGVSEEDTFVIGGGEIYRELLPDCDTLYVTRILRDDVGEVRFPDIPSNFVLTKGKVKTERGVRFRFDRYDRR